MVRHMSKRRTSPADAGIEQRQCRDGTRHDGLWNNLDIVNGGQVLIVVGFAEFTGSLVLPMRVFGAFRHWYLGRR
jgi:hypothetical protein